MANKYPTREYTNIVLCEDIRQEQFGKVSLMGVYGSKIGVPTTPVPINLVFVFLFDDGEGDFDPTFTLIGPKGVLISGMRTQRLHMVPGVTVNAGIAFRPTPLLEEGPYVGRLEFDDRTHFNRSFTIAVDSALKKTFTPAMAGTVGAPIAGRRSN